MISKITKIDCLSSCTLLTSPATSIAFSNFIAFSNLTLCVPFSLPIHSPPVHLRTHPFPLPCNFAHVLFPSHAFAHASFSPPMHLRTRPFHHPCICAHVLFTTHAFAHASFSPPMHLRTRPFHHPCNFAHVLFATHAFAHASFSPPMHLGILTLCTCVVCS